MCGIVGFVDRNTSPSESLVGAMALAIKHRGPDDAGAWVEPESGVAFGHRRLSILDLSVEGHQPMHSRSKRFSIVFNGEIYNYLDFRGELIKSGHTFRGHSDTEVMLAAFEEWGISKSLDKFNGMFAFAVWDHSTKQLHLVRDRIGKKPLYYGWSGGVFLFGSELKALRAHPKFAAKIDRGALALGMRHNYIPAPWSIYDGIYKLLPGTHLTLKLDQLTSEPPSFSPFSTEQRSPLRPEQYWSVEGAVAKGLVNPFKGSEEEATDRLESLLRDAVKIRMISDVPLGAFLSGGIDSSTIVALMQLESSKAVRTFSIGFTEEQYNEAQYAKVVAQHLKTEHTELYATPRDALEVIPQLPAMFDEPFSDSSQIPTYLVSKLCRSHVTVSLSGDGGDELFGGYNRYAMGDRIWSCLKLLPISLRGPIGAALQKVPPTSYEAVFRTLKPLLPKSFHFLNPGDKAHKLGRVLRVPTDHQLYHRLVSHWENLSELIAGYEHRITRFDQIQEWPAIPDFFSRMMYLDAVTYLPDDIMVKVDRASMAASLESRAPLLDYRVVEFAWSLPRRYKYSSGVSKRVLRNVLYRHVPAKLVDRPKMGFGVPIDLWLRGELRDWAESLLSPAKIDQQGFLNSGPIQEKWQQHLSGKRNWEYYLWDILMFQAWLDENRV